MNMKYINVLSALQPITMHVRIKYLLQYATRRIVTRKESWGKENGVNELTKTAISIHFWIVNPFVDIRFTNFPQKISSIQFSGHFAVFLPSPQTHAPNELVCIKKLFKCLKIVLHDCQWISTHLSLNVRAYMPKLYNYNLEMHFFLSICRYLHSNACITQSDVKYGGGGENQRIEMTKDNLCRISMFEVFCHAVGACHFREPIEENRQFRFGNIHNMSFKRDM